MPRYTRAAFTVPFQKLSSVNQKIVGVENQLKEKVTGTISTANGNLKLENLREHSRKNILSAD